MSKKRSFFERLTGGITLSDRDEKEESSSSGIVEMPTKSTVQSTPMVAKLTPLNSEQPKQPEPQKILEEEEEIANLSVDVLEGSTDIIVNAFVAGVNPDDIQITVTRNSVSIRGSRKDANRDGFEPIDQELFWGKFERDVMLSVDLEPDRAEATQKQGLLTIKVPKIDRDRRNNLKVKT